MGTLFRSVQNSLLPEACFAHASSNEMIRSKGRMDLGLEGRIALISAASGGIGRATATILAAEGVQTIVVARREPQLQELASELEAHGAPRPMVVVADLNQRDSFPRIRDQVL